MVADNDEFHHAFAIDEHADLPGGFKGKFGKIIGDFLRQHLFRRNFPPVQPFDAVKLIRLQAGEISVSFFNSRISRSCSC